MLVGYHHHFKCLGFWGLGFWGLGVWGFWVWGFRGLGCRVQLHCKRGGTPSMATCGTWESTKIGQRIDCGPLCTHSENSKPGLQKRLKS